MGIFLNKLLMGIMAMFMVMIGLSVPAHAGNPNYTCSDGETITDTSGRLHVHVPEGVSCTLSGASVFSVSARDAANVYVLSTEVAHNINVTGTTGNTVIGNEGCTYDPHAGNNVQVKDSHNVLICFETVDNNIKVFGNDGRITLRNNVANGSNILVNNNDAFVSDGASHHVHPGRIRLFENVAKNHIYAFHNHGRGVKSVDNSPEVVVK